MRRAEARRVRCRVGAPGMRDARHPFHRADSSEFANVAVQPKVRAGSPRRRELSGAWQNVMRIRMVGHLYVAVRWAREGVCQCVVLVEDVPHTPCGRLRGAVLCLPACGHGARRAGGRLHHVTECASVAAWRRVAACPTYHPAARHHITGSAVLAAAPPRRCKRRRPCGLDPGAGVAGQSDRDESARRPVLTSCGRPRPPPASQLP